MAVVVETTVGDITVDLFVIERPNTCRNFLKLCKAKYYNFCLFHSIQSNFVAQTGDPTGTGNEGMSAFGLAGRLESRYYAGEKTPKIRHDKPGLVSMVNCGDNMLGSQFFITLAPQLYSLDEHVVFGEVVEGFDVLLKLNDAICDNTHRPYQDIRITHTVVLDDPFEDIPGLFVPPSSPEPTAEIIASSRIGADEEIDESACASSKELQELKAQQEATAQATILEIIGDIPDKDIAPPENVLFVCKLNPVTTDEDLDIIFSRFGKINSCEVIRDKVTGDSLQYAFIEFAERKSCEEAYLKMDNVLIDDRRIHVDFSQSVSKMRWRGKGRGVDYLDGDGRLIKSKDEKSTKMMKEQGWKHRRQESGTKHRTVSSGSSSSEYEKRRNTGKDEKRKGGSSKLKKRKEEKRSSHTKYRRSSSIEKKRRRKSHDRYTRDKRKSSHHHHSHSKRRRS